MTETVKIHSDKPSTRHHYIPEWAEKRGLSQADLVRETGIDKSQIWRWFNGKAPKKREHILAIAGALELEDDIEAIYRHPDDDWITRFFRNKTEAERERAIEMLKLMFPEQENKKTG